MHISNKIYKECIIFLCIIYDIHYVLYILSLILYRIYNIKYKDYVKPCRSKSIKKKKANNPTGKETEDVHRQFTKEKTRRVNIHMERGSTSLEVREINISISTRYQFRPIRLEKEVQKLG